MMLVYLTTAWLIGLALARYAGLGYWPALPAVGGVVLLCLRKAPHKLRVLGALLCALALGGVRYQAAQPRLDAHQLAYYNDSGQFAVEGFISADPVVSSAKTQLQVCVERISDGIYSRSVSGQMLVTSGAFPRYEYGQRVTITGSLESPPLYDDFNYREYLASRGVLSVMRKAQIEVRPGNSGNRLTRNLLAANHRLRAITERILPQPESGLLQGVLLGADDALPEDAAETFRIAGLTHILVVSGFNISILMQLILLLANRAVRRQLALILALVGITFFGMLVGFTAPVSRAWLMGMLSIIALLTGRKAHPLTSLAAASLVMTIANPLVLWSVSFQLSFAATLALICVEPVFSRLINSIIGKKTWQTFAELLTTTVAAQLLTLPLIWHYFGQISLVALLANLLVLPLQPLILAAGAAAALVGACWLKAGQLVAYLLWPLLRYTILVPRWFSQLPLASLQLPRMSTFGMVVFYILAGAAVYALSRLNMPSRRTEGEALSPKSWALTCVLVIMIISLGALISSLPDGKTHIAVMDVGQGDAILITTPSGQTVLIDGGVDGLTLRTRLGEALPLNRHNLDMVVATHGDADHIGGLVDLPEYYQIGQVVRPPDLGSSSVAEAWQSAYTAQGVPQQTLSQGAVIQLDDGIALQVLNPAADAPSGNATSLVLRLSQGKFTMLLTGDIDSQKEFELLGGGQNLSAYLLKVAHHGSDSSSSELFLREVEPHMAVISVGKGNALGLPKQEVLDRLAASDCRIWRTDQQGTIEFITDGETLQVYTSR
ncbi:MAG: DNA internalization-related competence protein ComEC/Rec2 [Chloroflexi bacterium]|nr:DNA internalization-related competence protein ComEC/Rec2 [Chloroflexota bacterium]